MGRWAILLKYEVVWQQAFTVLDELRKQISHVEICIHLHLFWHEVKPSLASKAQSCRYHDVCGENLIFANFVAQRCSSLGQVHY